LLDVSVYGVPELSQQIRVNSSGDIYLPLIGYLGVEGLTVSEAQQLIEKRLTDGGFLKNPHVALFVKEYATSGISVLGEVTRPGIYPLLGSHRLFDALAAAGGTSTRAGKTVSITRRNRPNEPITVTLSRDPQKSAASNTAIYPGDTIVVSRAGVIYVVGEVQKPKGILMEDNERLTVLQALAIAEGAKPYAALDGSKLIRKTEGGHEEIPLPLKKMLQAKAPDVALQAEDILFVPASAGKNVAVKSLNAIIQVATGIAIYGSR
jgi:polysaccharide export outer membrane protein